MSELTAPVDVPRTIEPEPAAGEVHRRGRAWWRGRRCSGRLVGGVVGGLPDVPAPPPPPPQRGPIRIGGQIETPELVHRVEPFYPPVAVAAHLEGMVILEAIVDRDGTVAELKVLRSGGVLLDWEALLAVRQWRDTPLLLNGSVNGSFSP